MPGFCVFLHLQSCPSVSVQNQQVRKTLNVVGVILQYNAVRKIFLDPSNQL